MTPHLKAKMLLKGKIEIENTLPLIQEMVTAYEEELRDSSDYTQLVESYLEDLIEMVYKVY